MFTGIIEDLGTVESLKPTDQGAVISVHTSLPISEINIGDSIAVNGACLTVISKGPGTSLWTSRPRPCDAPGLAI